MHSDLICNLQWDWLKCEKERSLNFNLKISLWMCSQHGKCILRLMPNSICRCRNILFVSAASIIHVEKEHFTRLNTFIRNFVSQRDCFDRIVWINAWTSTDAVTLPTQTTITLVMCVVVARYFTIGTDRATESAKYAPCTRFPAKNWNSNSYSNSSKGKGASLQFPFFRFSTILRWIQIKISSHDNFIRSFFIEFE